MSEKGIIPEIPAQGVTDGNLQKVVGKTIEKIEYGFDRPFRPNAPVGELIILHFTDGASLRIQIGSNAINISTKYPNVKIGEFHADLIAIYTPNGSTPQ